MNRRQGFTLIELSIVLVIIGLIVGGVLVGRDLIKAAQIRKDLTTIEQLKTAVITFKNKYNCLPGDCVKAADYFTLPYTPSGDGDGFIGILDINRAGPGVGCREYGINDPTDGQGLEIDSAFDQLARANLISSIQPYTLPDTTISAYPGKGYPASAVSSNFGIIIATCDDGKNYIEWGATPINNSVVGFGGGDPAAAFGIDTKMDDGIPGSGTILERYSMNSNWYGVVSAFRGAEDCIDDGLTHYNPDAKTNFCPLRIDAGF